MENCFNGWKCINEVFIPPISAKGFKDPIIIREAVEPMHLQLPREFICEDATIRVVPEKAYSGYIRRLKTGEERKINEAGFIIGKSIEADYVIKDNPTISRKHAEIIYLEGIYYLRDLESLNHVFVEDRRIIEPIKLTNHISFRLSEDEEFEFIIRMV